MYISFLMFSVILELINPSVIKIDGVPIENAFIIAVACRFAITAAIYGAVRIFTDLYDFVVFVRSCYNEYKSEKNNNFIA